MLEVLHDYQNDDPSQRRPEGHVATGLLRRGTKSKASGHTGALLMRISNVTKTTRTSTRDGGRPPALVLEQISPGQAR